MIKLVSQGVEDVADSQNDLRLLGASGTCFGRSSLTCFREVATLRWKGQAASWEGGCLWLAGRTPGRDRCPDGKVLAAA